jgi:hypothetical protein
MGVSVDVGNRLRYHETQLGGFALCIATDTSGLYGPAQ